MLGFPSGVSLDHVSSYSFDPAHRELSLGSAIVAEEWVEAHDLYGRNRP